ncbi:MAG: hypothetical protein DMG96_25155 [Acidobacteria bacterium]|nr:MAG: hypothetical protein DMG96_25155 [Acidobacteriota bacterium]
MRRNTLPPLDTQAKKKEYIEKHLFDALRYLLAAATEWSIQKQLKLEIPGYEVQVYAMDSTLLRARTLFEFFTNETTNNYYGCTEFIPAPLQSPSYSELEHGWKVPLHSHLMHAQDRSITRKLNTASGQKDLNEMPVYFAKEILKLWKDFENELVAGGDPQLKALGELARGKRKEAIDAAKGVVNSAVARQHAEMKDEQLQPVFIFD